MKLRHLAVHLSGALVVYVAFAACAGSRNDAADQPADTGTAVIDAVVEVLGLDVAVPDADAAPDPGSPNVDGTRIKARYTRTTTADGLVARTFAGFWDSERAESCSPGVADDGATRCMPVGGGVGPIYFLDATCTAPAYVRAVTAADKCGGIAIPKYIATRTGPCSPGTTVLPVLGDGADPTTIYVGAACSPIPWSTLAGTVKVLAVGPAVPAASFAEATVTDEHG